MNELIGRQIENYRIDALLGEGGMGTVYRAYDLNLERPVAIKVMHPQLSRQKEFQQRFLQEARAAARLNDHPSIVTIHHFGGSQGVLFMVMALVTGGSLSAHIQRMQKTGEAVQLKEILALLAQVADALGYAHRKGVIHRDIKPSNVLVQRLDVPDREGDPPLRAIVTDFGLAKLLEGGLETRTGDILGTYGFMSPEQCLQKPLDGRSDIYSLGVMLYQLTTGCLPFDIQSPTDAVMKHLNETPPAPRTICPGLPVRVEAAILKAIAKKPEARFQLAEDIARELRETARQLTVVEMTRFTGQRGTVSLVTHQESPVAEQQPSRMGFDLTPIATKDQLVIARKDHTPRSIPLSKQQLIIGRSIENDIVLDHEDVSRQHARLERSSTGWQVTDLKSTNGTFLDGSPILAGVTEPFPAGKTLRIGPYFLHWRSAGSPAGSWAIPTKLSGERRSVPVDATRLQSSTGQIDVTVRPVAVEVLPGNRADVQVELFNQGMLVDQFKISVLDLPPAWVKIPQPVADLMPGTSAMLVFHILPPEDSSSKAGAYPYKILVQSQASPAESVTVTSQVVIKPFERFSIDMQPTRLKNKESSRVSIRNEGNSEGTYSLTGRDPAAEILFTGEQARIRIPPGETAVRPITASVKKRPLVGNVRTLPFEVLVTTNTNAQKGLPGQLAVQPAFPAWVLPLAGVMLVLCMVLGGFGLGAWNRNKTAATQTAGAATAIALGGIKTQESLLTQQSRDAKMAAEATAGAVAAQETSAALTAVAQGDKDKDGLSNQKEAELGTNPDNPDTDQDGLLDGQEVYKYSTDPKKNDTDGDNLTDGDEVNKYSTVPTNPDSDGDGILDGVDVFATPSATPTPSPTSTPTFTPSPTSTPTFTPSPTPTITPTFTPSPTPLPRAIGNWIDEDVNGGITRINIQFDGSTYFVETWGKCTPTDCYWNDYEGVQYLVSNITETTMTIQWIFSFVENTLNLEVLPDGRLKVSSHEHFTDNSGRSDFDAVYYFIRN